MAVSKTLRLTWEGGKAICNGADNAKTVMKYVFAPGPYECGGA